MAIAESVTQELLGDYIVAVELAKHGQFFWPALFANGLPTLSARRRYQNQGCGNCPG